MRLNDNQKRLLLGPGRGMDVDLQRAGAVRLYHVRPSRGTNHGNSLLIAVGPDAVQVIGAAPATELRLSASPPAAPAMRAAGAPELRHQLLADGRRVISVFNDARRWQHNRTGRRAQTAAQAPEPATPAPANQLVARLRELSAIAADDPRRVSAQDVLVALDLASVAVTAHIDPSRALVRKLVLAFLREPRSSDRLEQLAAPLGDDDPEQLREAARALVALGLVPGQVWRGIATFEMVAMNLDPTHVAVGNRRAAVLARMIDQLRSNQPRA